MMSSRYRFPLALTVFLGALILFQVQPIIARYILPWFGGSPAVWTTAMLFFQLMLLVGYGYTHWIVGRFALKHQIAVHMSLLCLAIATLPITPDANLKPLGDHAPTLHIIWLLLICVGLPYIMVSATTPLMQAWLTRADPKAEPYGHYALSNAGSVLGLLLYPLLIEPIIGVKSQTYLWSGAFILFCASSAWTARQIYKHKPSPAQPEAHSIINESTPTTSTHHITQATPISKKALFTWFSLSATGVILLLAATNQLCKDVAVIPLLWIVPLVLYLGSFILCFGRPTWYVRPLWLPLLVITIASVSYLLNQDYASEEVDLFLQVLIYAATVWICCTVCHGELFRLRPHATRLTLFYLSISVGGAAGGVFTTLIAPLLFPGYWEFHLSLLLTLFIGGYFCFRDKTQQQPRWLKGIMILLWVTCIVIIGFLLLRHIQLQRDESIFAKRNFYGVLRVYEQKVGTRAHIRELYHGRISHGSQFFHPRFRNIPIAYYGKQSGVGLAITSQRKMNTIDMGHSRLRIGVIGQGISTIAAHGFAGDLIRFYEIDPDVSEISRSFFTFESDSEANVEVLHGDARISLERTPPQNYDVIIVDAFSGDGIPVHLLTQEALTIYQKHLAPHGTIAFHISNLHFDLRPVIRGLSNHAQLQALWMEQWGRSKGEDANDWVLITGNRAIYDVLKPKAKAWPTEGFTPILWTDDYANLFATRWRNK